MSYLTHIMLFGWPILGSFAFKGKDPRKAVVFIVIGGWLFLPHVSFSFNGLPDYNKYWAISAALLMGYFFSEKSKESNPKNLSNYILYVWCLVPIVTATMNGLGMSYGISSVLQHVMVWGVPFMVGREYFNSKEDLRFLCIALIIGGLIYVPLCLFEVRMSPRLNVMIYDFFPHDWRQHYHSGGWRPIVFLQHGLMVSLWMALTTVVAFWSWRAKMVDNVVNMPIKLVFIILFCTTLLCKSNGAIFLMVLGCLPVIFFNKKNMLRFLLLLVVSIPVFLGLRVGGAISTDSVIDTAEILFDNERVGSLEVRLNQEDLSVGHVMKRKWFGWGGYGRNWPKLDSGQNVLRALDSLWLIQFSTWGFVGLGSLFGLMLYAPFRSFRFFQKREQLNPSDFSPLILGLIVTLFMIDQVLNSMVNPIYTLVAGGLAGGKLSE